MTKEKKKFQQLTSENICNIYKLLYKEGLVSFPVEECVTNKIEALISSVNSVYFGKDIYPSHGEKAVAHLYFIIKDHIFVDGNKRTACLSFSVLCELNDLNPKYKNFTLDELAVLLEDYKGKNHQVLIKEVAKLLFN
ncbi:MAG: Fic family protein [Parcubacteria group bacterium]|jgi:prophage maintenance system killer protein